MDAEPNTRGPHASRTPAQAPAEDGESGHRLTCQQIQDAYL